MEQIESVEISYLTLYNIYDCVRQDCVSYDENLHDFLKFRCGLVLLFKGEKIEVITKNHKQYMYAKLKYNIDLS